MFGANLVINESAFHADVILLLKVNFLTFVLLSSTHNLYSAFLVMSSFTSTNDVKIVSNFKTSIWLIILHAWIKSLLNFLYYKVGKSSFFSLSV